MLLRGRSERGMFCRTGSPCAGSTDFKANLAQSLLTRSVYVTSPIVLQSSLLLLFLLLLLLLLLFLFLLLLSQMEVTEHHRDFLFYPRPHSSEFQAADLSSRFSPIILKGFCYLGKVTKKN
jgi:Ca2+/Na+ antiporter